MCHSSGAQGSAQDHLRLLTWWNTIKRKCTRNIKKSNRRNKSMNEKNHRHRAVDSEYSTKIYRSCYLPSRTFHSVINAFPYRKIVIVSTRAFDTDRDSKKRVGPREPNQALDRTTTSDRGLIKLYATRKKNAKPRRFNERDKCFHRFLVIPPLEASTEN